MARAAKRVMVGGLAVWLVPSAWVDVIIGVLVGLAMSLLGADCLLRRRRHLPAIVTVAIANWATVIVVAAMVPFALTIVPIPALLPILLAVPYLRRVQIPPGTAMTAPTLFPRRWSLLAGKW